MTGTILSTSFCSGGWGGQRFAGTINPFGYVDGGGRIGEEKVEGELRKL